MQNLLSTNLKEMNFKIMNLSSTKETINKLDNINPLDDYAYEKALLAFYNLSRLPVLLYKIPVGFRLFHSRTHNTKELFHKVTDIAIPPRQVVKDFARCNRPYQSVFYCAENRPTSFMEIVEYWAETKSFGETLKVTIGIWELIKEINVIIITTPDPENRKFDYDKEHGMALDEYLNKFYGEELESQKIFYRYMFEKFRKHAKNDLKTYIITSAYCNMALMHAGERANAIYYPSVPFQGNGMNLAINELSFNSQILELKLAVCNSFSVTENELCKHSFTETNKIVSKDIKLNEDLIIWG